jgi:hypothetical protein
MKIYKINMGSTTYKIAKINIEKKLLLVKDKISKICKVEV